MAQQPEKKFRFSAAQVVVDASFWQELARRKMEQWQLDSKQKHPLMTQVFENAIGNAAGNAIGNGGSECC